MINRRIHIIFFAFISILTSSSCPAAQGDVAQRHIGVSIRMIGHQILLQSGDSSSRVLPIEKVADRYLLQFENDLQFNPDELVMLIDQVVKETSIASSYLVEVEQCESNQVIYSYEIGNSVKSDVIPCRGRNQPKACYRIYFTILDVNSLLASWLSTVPTPVSNSNVPKKQEVNYSILILLVFPLLLIGLLFIFYKRYQKSSTDPNLIAIGAYQFNKTNMELTFQDETMELSSKEADLLLLLHSSANATLERKVILKSVWGDEGDYVGRTLDVFISKLRKKMNGDENLKIVNIRGIGYKLVLNA